MWVKAFLTFRPTRHVPLAIFIYYSLLTLGKENRSCGAILGSREGENGLYLFCLAYRCELMVYFFILFETFNVVQHNSYFK